MEYWLVWNGMIMYSNSRERQDSGTRLTRYVPGFQLLGIFSGVAILYPLVMSK